MMIKDDIVIISKNTTQEIILDKINALGTKLELTNEMIHKTKYIYQKAKEVGIVRGRSSYPVLAAAAYIDSRQLGVTKTMTDFTSILRVGRKQLARNYRLLINKLSLKIPSNDPFILLDKLASKCKVGEETKRQANILMNYTLRSDFHVGKNPMSIVSSVLYIACATTLEHRSQTVIARAAGITSVTLGSRIKDLKELLCSSNNNSKGLSKDINGAFLVSFNGSGALN
jgi:transcription initiation factor TFIIIB Brf1 subunit/transcription initiation factor TFIIB